MTLAMILVSLFVRPAAAQPPEHAAAAGERAFADALASAPRPVLNVPAAAPAPEPPAQEPARKLFEKPELSPIAPNVVGPLLASFPLAERLDVHRALLNRVLGALAWDLSMASDPGFDVQYLTLSRPPALGLHRIDDLNRLRGDGVVVQVDPRTRYRVKVSINILSPVRGSTVHLQPADGSSGPSHKVKTGEVLDLVKSKSVVFTAGGKQFWLLYGTDVDPGTNALAATRSLLFVHENGLDSKAWPVAESILAADRPVSVGLGGVTVSLVRQADGVLRIHGR